MISTDQWVEEVVEKTAIDMYGSVDAMPAHNKATLRNMLRKEAAFWDRYQGKEEEGHSNSVVGDRNNMREY